MEKESRRFSIRVRLLEDVKCVEDYFGLNNETLGAMAIFHGLQSIKNGYIPRHDNKKIINKETIKITLPTEIWNQFNDCQKKFDMAGWKLIEVFLDVELKRFLEMIQDYENIHSQNKAEKRSKISFNGEISSNLYADFNAINKFLDVKKTQLIKYLLTSSIIEEHRSVKYDVIYSDSDLLDEIDRLGLDRLKALCLVKYILKYKYK